MNEQALDVKASPVIHVAPCDASSISTAPQLVVVLQHADEEAELASRIFELARQRDLAVALFGITLDASGAAELRRRLVTIAAFIREEQARLGPAFLHGPSAVNPEVHVESGRQWMNRLHLILHEQDTIACYSHGVGFLERPLDAVLGSGLSRTVIVMAADEAPRQSARQVASQAAAWIGSLASIGGFLALQVRLVNAVTGWPQTVLLLMLVGVEIAWIWFLNSLSGPF